MKRLRFIRSTWQIVIIAMLMVLLLSAPAASRAKQQGVKEAQLDTWVAEITGKVLTPEKLAELTEKELQQAESSGQKDMNTYIKDRSLGVVEWLYVGMAENRGFASSGWSNATILEYVQWRLHVWLSGILLVIAAFSYWRVGGKMIKHQDCKDTKVEVRGMDDEIPFSRENFGYLMAIMISGLIGLWFGRVSIALIDLVTALIVTVRYFSFVSEGGKLIEPREDEDRWHVRMWVWFTKKFHIERRKKDDSGFHRPKRGFFAFLKKGNRPSAEAYVTGSNPFL